MPRTALFCVVVLLVATRAPARDETASRPPHILLILADDLGWKDVGYHGSEIATPHLDRLAARGVKLEQFHVQHVCSPTRSSLMTGRFPIRHGMQTHVIWPWADWGVPLGERMLPEALREVGYRTVICGKWHLGMQKRAFLPRQRGFDHQYGHYLGAIDYFTHLRDGGLDWHRNGSALREEGYTTELIAKEAVRIVEAHDASRPLFLYVPFNAPHTPLQAPPAYLDRYRHITNKKRRAYAAMVTCMDDAIGRIVGAFEAKKLFDDTVTFFSSDNGGPVTQGANNGALRGSKGSLYQGGLRVPAFVVWPGKLKGGRSVDALMHIVDWHPTILRLAGVTTESPHPLDGVDMWRAIAESAPSPRDELLHNVEPPRGALRKGPWKLVVTKRRAAGGARIELFRIDRDPNEQHDLAAAEPEKVKELMARLIHYEKQALPSRGWGYRKPRDFEAPKVWEPRD